VTMSLGFFFMSIGYLVITFGELCPSPIGLSAVSKLSPPRSAPLMMGVVLPMLARPLVRWSHGSP
jgi:dipeptide/tripeptide permease